MRNSKKWMTAVLTAAMVVSQVVPAFASSASITGDGTGSGTANILAYSVDRIVVPTTLKIGLNPNKYSLVKGYKLVESEGKTTGSAAAAKAERTAGAAIFERSFDDATNKWVYKQVLASGTASETTVIKADDDMGDSDKTAYYSYDFTTDQVISLNYGIANKSTNDKVVQIDIKVNQDTNDKAGKVPIEFVDTKAKAEYNTAVANSAKQNEMKMYLGIAAAAGAAPTTDTFERVTAFLGTGNAESGDGKADANTVLYTKNEDDGTYEVLTTDSAATSGLTITGGKTTAADFDKVVRNGNTKVKVYKISNKIGPEITATQLSDVAMTKTAEANWVAFEAGKENKANASIGFKLVQAKYGVEKGETIDAFTTTQEGLGNRLQLTGLTGTAGFTIVGAMNQKVDWTRADTVALKIQPTYKVSDAKGDEEYIDDDDEHLDLTADPVVNVTDPYNQVNIVTSYVSAKTISSSQSSVTVTLPDGVTVSSIELYGSDGTTLVASLVSGTHYTLEDNTYSFSTYVDSWSGRIIKFTYSNDVVDIVTIQ